MANMSYCRFENTLSDLRDCEQHMDATDLSEHELKAREWLLLLCARIAADYEYEIDDIRDAKRKLAKSKMAEESK